MRTSLARFGLGSAAAAAVFLSVSPQAALAQGRGRGGAPGGGQTSAAVTAQVTFSVGDLGQIRQYYASHASLDAEALPPGIRKNLERGKPLPPGIAKKAAPPELRAAVPVPDGYEVVEVGLDVVLVEVATNIVHDVLTDVIR